MSEVRERNFFHRPPAQVVYERTVVHDLAGAHVNPVMRKATTWCNEVCAQGGLLVVRQ